MHDLNACHNIALSFLASISHELIFVALKTIRSHLLVPWEMEHKACPTRSLLLVWKPMDMETPVFKIYPIGIHGVNASHNSSACPSEIEL